MKLFKVLIFSLLCLQTYSQNVSNLINAERHSFYSDILKMQKNYQVFLPESYHYAEKGTYPVVYIIDGDYNFYYQTGIVESLSNISEKIPELIVVAISDNGNEGYRKDCTIKTAQNPNGNAENFIRYIEEDLKPEIEKKYKVSDFQILIGHSLGGLFTTNVFLRHPEYFSAYIAIDPSYWWDDYNAVTVGDSLLKNKKELTADLFVSLANTKQMGVHEFVGVLEKYMPDSKKWTFKHYPDQSHGSVGIFSVHDGLLNIFENWEMDREEFYALDSSSAVMEYYKDRSKQYKSVLRIPPFQLSNIIHYYYRNARTRELAHLESEIQNNFPSSMDDFFASLGNFEIGAEKYTEAEQVLNRSIKLNPNAYKSHDALSKLFFAKKEYKTALQHAKRSIEIAEKVKVRQWQYNELLSNLKKIQTYDDNE